MVRAECLLVSKVVALTYLITFYLRVANGTKVLAYEKGSQLVCDFLIGFLIPMVCRYTILTFHMRKDPMSGMPMTCATMRRPATSVRA